MTRSIAIVMEEALAGDVMELGRAVLADFGVASTVIVGTDTLVADDIVIVGTTKIASGFLDRISLSTSSIVLIVPVALDNVNALELLRACSENQVGAGVLAIGKAGAINAALLAISMLANGDDTLQEKLETYRATQTQTVMTDRQLV